VDLRNARGIKVTMDRIKEHIEVLKSALEYGERILHNGTGSNYPTDKISRIVARIEELTDQYVSLALDYDIEVTMAEQAIEKLSESEQKIARARYIDGLPWRQVAAQTNYSVSHCRNKNLDIIKKVEGL
jgi:DNA-directed RNA polymerase specialized sigma subunit